MVQFIGSGFTFAIEAIERIFEFLELFGEGFFIGTAGNLDGHSYIDGASRKGQGKYKTIPAVEHVLVLRGKSQGNDGGSGDAGYLQGTGLRLASGSARSIGDQDHAFVAPENPDQRTGGSYRHFKTGTANHRIPHQAGEPGQQIAVRTGADEQMVIPVAAEVIKKIKDPTVPQGENKLAGKAVEILFGGGVLMTAP